MERLREVEGGKRTTDRQQSYKSIFEFSSEMTAYVVLLYMDQFRFMLLSV